MMIAAVHIELPITLPLAGLLAMALVWYWRRLSRSSMPHSRRRIRRVTTVLMGICLPVFVLGLSVHDPEVNQQGYLLTWTGDDWTATFVISASIYLVGAVCWLFLDSQTPIRMPRATAASS